MDDHAYLFKRIKALSKWFRLYNEVLNDPKVQALDAETFRHWINLLCIASMKDGVLPDVADIAFHLRIEKNAVVTLLERLLNATLIDKLNGGTNGYHYAPHNWDKRQYKSDTSTERVKRFRQRSETVTVTPPDTDTDTDTEQNKKYIHQPKQVRSKDSKSDLFDKFWLGYPRKVGKGAAEKAWVKAVQSTEAQTIIASLGSHKFSEDINYIPHPATWLNQRRWEDVAPVEVAPAAPNQNAMAIPTPEANFPSDGSVEYTPWASRIRAHNTGHDPDWIANRFRDFCRSKNIAFNSPHIVKALDGFTRAQKRV